MSISNHRMEELRKHQEMLIAKDLPSFYLDKIHVYLDPKATRSKKKIVKDTTSTLVLKDLEVSLRTNNIEWVKQFLGKDFQGLDVLVDYLNFRLSSMQYEQCNVAARLDSSVLKELTAKRLTKHVTKLNIGTAAEDVHSCVMCIRAIMNNEHGFNLMLHHQKAVNCITLSLIHKSLRTKAIILELLAAICLACGDHTFILSAFDNFKRVCNEKSRFQTLMDFFMKRSTFHIDFQIACMQFVNIVVHSVEGMNYRVHLQYEFTALGLDDYLKELRSTESEELHSQISAYLDNMLEVASLLEDSEIKEIALDRVKELEEDLGETSDKVESLEREMVVKIGSRDAEISKMKFEMNNLRQRQLLFQKYEEDACKLKEQEEELAKLKLQTEKQKEENEMLKQKVGTLEKDVKEATRKKLADSKPQNSVEAKVSAPPPAPPPMQSTTPPAPPPISGGPPPPPPMGGPPPPPGGPPPPPGGPLNSQPTKPPIKTTHKLPVLHWVALKPDVKHKTIFDEVDDDNVYKQITFNEFEERFKIVLKSTKPKTDLKEETAQPKKIAKVSLLDTDRLRNLAILRRFLNKPIEVTVQAINTFDLSTISLECVEQLQSKLPTEQEEKLFKLYTVDKKDMNLLTDDDLFLFELTKVERLNAKLDMMCYIGNFYERFNVVGQQVSSVMSASTSLKSSTKFKAVLEIVLAFGNYLNSGKRGRRDYGFKLQSLNRLCDTKSTDKRMNLLHYVVATIREKFPHLVDFDTELSCIDKAATVTLEIVVTDFNDLEKGMEMVKKEVNGEVTSGITALKDFLVNNEEKFKEMKEKTKAAQDAFKECVEYFGESREKTDVHEFFSLIVRFVKEFKESDQQNVKRMRLEQAALEKQQQKEDEALSRSKPGQKVQMTSKRTSFVLAAPRRQSILDSFISADVLKEHVTH